MKIRISGGKNKSKPVFACEKLFFDKKIFIKN